MKIQLDDLIEVAFAFEEGDPMEWDVFEQGKEHVMKMLGITVLEKFDKDIITDDDKLILLGTVTKLLTENMILNAKILRMNK